MFVGIQSMCAGVYTPPSLRNSKSVDQLFLLCDRNTDRVPIMWDEALPYIQRYMPNMCSRVRGVMRESSWAVCGSMNTCLRRVMAYRMPYCCIKMIATSAYRQMIGHVCGWRTLLRIVRLHASLDMVATCPSWCFGAFGNCEYLTCDE